jgi:hypothetical protein
MVALEVTIAAQLLAIAQDAQAAAVKAAELAAAARDAAERAVWLAEPYLSPGDLSTSREILAELAAAA